MFDIDYQVNLAPRGWATRCCRSGLRAPPRRRSQLADGGGKSPLSAASEADLFRALPDELDRASVEAERAEETLDAIVWQPAANPGDERPRRCAAIEQRQARCRNRQDMNVRIGRPGGLDGPRRRLVALPEPHAGRARGWPAWRIVGDRRDSTGERCRTRRWRPGDRRTGRERSRGCSGRREFGAQLDATFELGDRFVRTTVQPQHHSHRPVRGRRRSSAPRLRLAVSSASPICASRSGLRSRKTF